NIRSWLRAPHPRLFAPTLNASPSNIVNTPKGSCASWTRMARPIGSLRAKRWYVAPIRSLQEPREPVPVDTQTMERAMRTQQERAWPAIDLAELRFGVAFGSSAEELADFLQRDLEDVKQKWAAEVRRSPPRA